MSYQSYQDVFCLDPNSLQQLLVNGDAVERLWAAWSLGVTLGKGSFPVLTTRLNEEPEPGIRCHLLVIFAGDSNHAVLRIFAQDDPDAHVRATACQYLIRISPETDKFVRDFIKTRLLSDPSSIVKQTILQEAPSNSSNLQLEEWKSLINDESIQVRRLVVSRLLELYQPHQLFPAVLENRVWLEPEYSLRQEILDLSIHFGGELRLVEVCNKLDSKFVLEILERLVEFNKTFSWKTLQPLTSAQNPFYDVLLAQLLQTELKHSNESVNWLFKCMAQAYDLPQPKNRQESKLITAVRNTANYAENHLISNLSTIKNIEALNFHSETIQIVITYLQESVQHLRWDKEDDWEVEDDWYEQTIQEKQKLEKFLRDRLK